MATHTVILQHTSQDFKATALICLWRSTDFTLSLSQLWFTVLQCCKITTIHSTHTHQLSWAGELALLTPLDELGTRPLGLISSLEASPQFGSM